MFQFRRFPTYAYLIQRRLTEYCSAGFPHSVISGSTAICASPKLIAACHVLHRLLMPRHSPCALISLTYRPAFTGLLEKLSGSHRVFRIMQALEFDKIVLFYPFNKKFHNLMFVSLCCLLFILWLLCSVFKVRFSDLKSDPSTQHPPNA